MGFVRVAGFCCGLLLSFWGSCAYASSIEDTVMSDDALNAAVGAIKGMSRDELVLFIDYQATCDAAEIHGGGASAFECARAQKAYAYRYANGRPLDRYLTAVAFANHLVSLNDNLPEGKRRDLGPLILRTADVQSVIEIACGVRFREVAAAR